MAIMLFAALSMVLHGAVAVMAHPLTAKSFHYCEGQGKRAAAEASHEDVHGPHHHSEVAQSQVVDHPEHCAKLKSTRTCCSAVSAAVLPFAQAGGLFRGAAVRVRAVLTVTGEGYAPPTPSKPPRQTYQS